MLDFNDADPGIADSQPSVAELMGSANLLPMISGRALEDMVLGGHGPIMENYATAVKYPLPDLEEPTRIAKYQNLNSNMSVSQTKRHYLITVAKYIKDELAKNDGVDAEVIAAAVNGSKGLTVSGFARQLGYPTLDKNDADHPLMILANLPLPVFLTTSPFTFIEDALRVAEKRPRTNICRWHSGLDLVKSKLNSELDLAPDDPECEHNKPGNPYKPCEHYPLVYHLYGLDTNEASLVLTEDDFLVFLMEVSQGRAKDEGFDPLYDIRSVLLSSHLLLLGFRLDTWAFRALYWALIEPIPETSAKEYERHCCVQLTPSEDEKRYFKKYLRQDARFNKVSWETTEDFCRSELKR